MGSKYFLTGDHHTNDRGYLKQLKVILNELGLVDQIPELKAIFKTNATKHGDLINKLSTKVKVKEESLESINGRFPCEPVFDLRKYLKSNSGQIKYYYNKDAYFNKRLLTFGDSFIGGGLDIWSIFFDEIIHFRSPYVIEDIVKSLNPDYVITGNAERYLVNVPDYYSKPWFMNYLLPGSITKEIPKRIAKILSGLFSKGRCFKLIMENEFTLHIDPAKKLSEITILDIINSNDINYIRSKAESLENVDIDESLRLMRIANVARPEGEYIKRKIMEYEKIILKTKSNIRDK